jgi:hypothetical protein
MGAVKLKKELFDLIQQEDDVEILNALKTILNKNHTSNTLRDKLEIRAKKSSEEIAEDKLYTLDDVVQILNEPDLRDEL